MWSIMLLMSFIKGHDTMLISILVEVFDGYTISGSTESNELLSPGPTLGFVVLQELNTHFKR